MTRKRDDSKPIIKIFEPVYRDDTDHAKAVSNLNKLVNKLERTQATMTLDPEAEPQPQPPYKTLPPETLDAIDRRELQYARPRDFNEKIQLTKTTKLLARPEVRARVVEAISRGASRNDVADALGVSRNGFYQAMHEDRSLYFDVKEAESKIKMGLVGTILDIAMQSEREPLRLKAAQFFLERRYKEWRQKSQTDQKISGQVAHSHNVTLGTVINEIEARIIGTSDETAGRIGLEGADSARLRELGESGPVDSSEAP